MAFVSLEYEDGSHHWLERLVTNSSLDYNSMSLILKFHPKAQTLLEISGSQLSRLRTECINPWCGSLRSQTKPEENLRRAWW